MGIIHGLKLVAVAIVAQAVWGIARTLCPDRQSASIGGVAALMILFSTSSVAQIGTIAMGGLAGFWLCRTSAPTSTASLGAPVSRRVGTIALTTYLVLLAALPALGRISQSVELFDAFYRSGALVFGGGHVVLPLLSKPFVTPGWVNEDTFLAGYGAAQAVPGPLFTFGAYLGAVATPSPHGIAGAAMGLMGIFLPGFLVLLGTLPFWDVFRQRVGAQAIMRGINAAVVGLLGAALYNPLWISSVKSSADFAITLTGFILLVAWRAPPLVVVILGALSAVAFGVCGALALRFIRRLDGGEHFGLVEQHRLVRVLLGGGGQRGASVVLGLQPPYFLLEQYLAFDGLLMFAFQLLMRGFDLLEPLVLFTQQPDLLFGDIQTDGKLGDFIR
jgi:chromate transporter